MSVRLPGRSDGSPNLPISSALQTHGDYPIFRRSNSNWSRSQKARIRNLSLVSIRSPFLLESRPNRLPASCGRSLPGGSRKDLTTKHLSIVFTRLAVKSNLKWRCYCQSRPAPGLVGLFCARGQDPQRP